MKRFSSLLSKRPAKSAPDSPEETVKQAVKAFCESGGPTNNTGDEVAHLPIIVEATEATPEAAYAAVTQIRKYLGKDNFIYPYKQYNAVMLIRILVDNPGQIFTRSMDAKFEHTVRDVLRYSRDPSVQQLLRETLTNFEHTKKDMPGITALLKMWEKERAGLPVQQMQRGAVMSPATPRVHSNGRPRHALPGPEELSGRIEEAKTSAKLLMQFVSTTPPEEFANHELIKEFADRCVSAQRSLQGYMHCTNPAPDEPTLQTLIETCEQLSLASSKHQRAMLAARRQNSMRSETGAQGPLPDAAVPTNGQVANNWLGSGPLQQAPQVPALQPMPTLASPTSTYANGGTDHSATATADPFSDTNRVADDLRGLQMSQEPAATTVPVARTRQVDNDSDDDLYGATPLKQGYSALASDGPAASPTTAANAPHAGGLLKARDAEPIPGVKNSGTGQHP